MSPSPPPEPQGNLKKSNGTIYGTTEVTEEHSVSSKETEKKAETSGGGQ
jgi:hypothetical protein